jgi:zinc D-Ala-D-Ala carboxypeptidase
MQAAARSAGIDLWLLSAFRSIARQAELLRRKLAAGQDLDEALRFTAYPGHSEHHTGRAVDVGTAGCEHLSEAFDQTAAFAWLTAHAASFGFHLSYPKETTSGIGYEPWHWCWAGAGRASESEE